jgi:hypothetical protein
MILECLEFLCALGRTRFENFRVMEMQLTNESLNPVSCQIGGMIAILMYQFMQSKDALP